jgi:hypothetical protein
VLPDDAVAEGFGDCFGLGVHLRIGQMCFMWNAHGVDAARERGGGRLVAVALGEQLEQPRPVRREVVRLVPRVPRRPGVRGTARSRGSRRRRWMRSKQHPTRGRSCHHFDQIRILREDVIGCEEPRRLVDRLRDQ